MNWTEIITACIAALGAVCGSAMMQSKTTAVLQAKLDALKEDVKVLSGRVDKHNGVIERTAVLEHELENLKGR